MTATTETTATPRKRSSLLLWIAGPALVLGVAGWLYLSGGRFVATDTAYVQADPAVITLTWRPNAGATQHNVFRKLKNSSSWGTAVANLPGDATQYIDSTVVRTLNYEYRVIRQAAAYTGYGYINAGIEVKGRWVS